MNLVNELQSLLSDVVTFYLKTHGCHWNVEGADFSEYHAFFAEIYEDTYSSIDPIAENLRKIGAYAPFTLAAFSQLRTLTETEFDTTPLQMSASLLADNDKLLVRLDQVFMAANNENRQGIANFIAERIDQHLKWSWQLRASIK